MKARRDCTWRARRACLEDSQSARKPFILELRISMLRIAVAAFVLAVTGCASSSSGVAAGGRGGNATVTGSITYPESGLQGAPCSSVSVKVTEGNSAALGWGDVKQSRKNT